MLEPDQRVDVIYASSAQVDAGLRLQPQSCRVLVYPEAQLISDHYGVVANIALETTTGRSGVQRGDE